MTSGLSALPLFFNILIRRETLKGAKNLDLSSNRGKTELFNEGSQTTQHFLSSWCLLVRLLKNLQQQKESTRKLLYARNL